MSEQTWQLPEIEVFAAGSERGKEYTARDLDQMVANFEKASKGQRPGFLVPAVIGHEEEPGELDRLLSNTGAYADGTAASLRRDGDKLKATFRGVSPKLAEAIRDGRILACSAEVYDEPPHGVPGSGKMLRRVAFLGAALPEKKTLAPLPQPSKNSEQPSTGSRYTLNLKHCRPTADGTFHCYAEATPMGDETMTTAPADATPPAPDTSSTAPMLEQLQSLGFDSSVLPPDASPALVSEIVRCLSDAKQQAQPAPENFWEQDPPDEMDPDKKQMYAERGRKLMAYGEACVKKYGEQPTPPKKDDDEDTPMKPEQFAELVKPIVAAAVTQAVAEVKREFTAKTERLDKFAEERLAADKKATIKSRLDALVHAGKVLPAERDGGLDDTLYSLPADRVEKFTEAGKVVEMTPLDRMFKSLESRPCLVKFGEQVRGGAKGASGANAADAEVERVERFSEEPSQAAVLKAAGKTPARYVADFKAIKAKKPEFTAAQYGVPAAGA